jgi:hypothetical protein
MEVIEVGDLVQTGAIITAIVGLVLGILGKCSWYQKTWTPKTAPILGAALTIVATLLGLLPADTTLQAAIGLGAGFGAAAVGVHNAGKRMAPAREGRDS